MKAVLYDRYGPPDVLELREVDPPPVADGEVLVRVHASSVNAADWHLLTADPWVVRLFWGFFKPKRNILGLDMAGRVERVGAKVTRVRPGDAVFGTTDAAGAFAEYMCLSEDNVVPKPANLTHEQAAAAPVSALTALQGLRDRGRIRSGQKVLVIGASGGVGTFAVQIAKAFGAEVTGVCSARNLEQARSLGADQVIDYRREDFTAQDRRYDLVLDLVGKTSLAACRRILTPEGIYVAAAGPPTRLLRVGLTGGRRMVSYVSRPNQADLMLLRELLESGKVTPVIERRYPLEEVGEALRYFGEGHARGKLAITV